MGATFPNDYLFTTDKPLPATLEDQLRRIAEQYSEELFEFEGTASDVAVVLGRMGWPRKGALASCPLDRLAPTYVAV